MHTSLRIFALLLFFAVARADDSLAHARAAQVLAGADSWSRVIRIENDAWNSRYPRTLHALVFEFYGRLWFYADVNGTQSLSVRANHLEEDKRDLGPLLKEIEQGFSRWSEVPDDGAGTVAGRGPLPNGCFLESLAAARSLGGRVEEAQLLTFYQQAPGGLRGHTVLVFAAGGRAGVIDSGELTLRDDLPSPLTSDSLALGRAIGGKMVVKARLLPAPAAAEGRMLPPVANDAKKGGNSGGKSRVAAR